MIEVEVFWSGAVYKGKFGCYRARLKNDHRVHDAGATPQEAFNNLVITAGSFGHPKSEHSYTPVEKG